MVVAAYNFLRALILALGFFVCSAANAASASNQRLSHAMHQYLSAVDAEDLNTTSKHLVRSAEESLRDILVLPQSKQPAALKEWGSLWGRALSSLDGIKKWQKQNKLLGGVVYHHTSARLPDAGLRIYYINGIGGSLIQAVKNKTFLEKALQNSSSLKLQQASYALAFNPSDEVLVDILQSASQLSIDLSAEQLGSLLNPFGNFVKDVIEKISDSALQKKFKKFYQSIQRKIEKQKRWLDRLSASDLKQHIAAYQKDLDAGIKVLLVSHSQGAFYANAAIEAIQAEGQNLDHRDLAVYAVSSPVGALSDGRSSYLTHDRDIIRFVPGSFGPNFKLLDAAGNEPDLAIDRLHYFSTYISPLYNARSRIVSDITKKIAVM